MHSPWVIGHSSLFNPPSFAHNTLLKPWSEGTINNCFPGRATEELPYLSTSQTQFLFHSVSLGRRELLWISHFTADSWEVVSNTHNIFISQAASSWAGSLEERNTINNNFREAWFKQLVWDRCEPRIEHSSLLKHLSPWLCFFQLFLPIQLESNSFFHSINLTHSQNMSMLFTIWAEN